MVRKNCKWMHNGIEVRVDEHYFTRGGSKSPTTLILIYKGRTITPYERHVRGWCVTMNQLFFNTYHEVVEKCIPSSNLLLKAIKSL